MSSLLALQYTFSDLFLAPLRREMATLPAKGNTVLEAGCRSGDWLFRIAPKIQRGLGIDLNPLHIRHAHRRLQQDHFRHVDFLLQDPAEMRADLTPQFDFAAMTLCLHPLPRAQAVESLQRIHAVSRRLVVAELAPANTRRARVRHHCDAFLSGSYPAYRAYLAGGGLPGLVQEAGLRIAAERPSAVDGIRLYEISV